ncbi:MAG: hypothetical protein V4724_15050 [Pseudomonadota bacterium]
MSTATNLTFHTNTERSYVSNVFGAARALLAALLAVKPRHPAVIAAAAAKKAAAAERSKMRDIKDLYELANSCATVSPSMAGELRHLASRG